MTHQCRTAFQGRIADFEGRQSIDSLQQARCVSSFRARISDVLELLFKEPLHNCCDTPRSGEHEEVTAINDHKFCARDQAGHQSCVRCRNYRVVVPMHDDSRLLNATEPGEAGPSNESQHLVIVTSLAWSRRKVRKRPCTPSINAKLRSNPRARGDASSLFPRCHFPAKKVLKPAAL